MNPEGDYLTGRFGRRMFGLLFVVVIAPVAVASFIAVASLEHELRQQAGQRLHQSAKEYGLSVLQRLTAVKREAVLFEETGVAGSENIDLPFQPVTVDIAQLMSRSDAPPASREPGGARPLLITTVSAPGPGYYMILRGGESPLVVEIVPDYIWGPVDYLPLPDLCVTGYGDRRLFCSSDTASALLTSVSETSGNRTTDRLETDDETYLAQARELFLPSEFEGSEWTVHAFQPERRALSPATTFKYLFAPSMVALIAGTLLLGIMRIRRRLRPLDRLVAGTRRVANQDFSTRIEVSSGDEFENLADAFNDMTRNLGRQISTLRTLSTIDKTILQTLDLEIVSSHVLTGLTRLTPATCAVIAAFDQDSAENGQLYIASRTSGDIEKRRARLQFPDVDWTRCPDGMAVDPDSALPPLADTMRNSGALSCFAMPFHSERRLDGMIYLGLPGADGPDAGTRRIMEDFRDRLAVAAAAIKKEHLLQKQANFDFLTGLPNRALVRDRLDRLLIHARHAGSEVALLFLDLDRFKMVNDTMGHTFGDHLLVEAAERLLACIEEGDTLARLGGDEFVILLSDIDAPDRVVAMTERILERMAAPFMAGNREMLLGASIGIALFPRDGGTSEELLRNADIAMYEAKNHGRGRYFLFNHSMNRELEKRARMEADLWRAVQNDELELWYQPQIDLVARKVRGAEALIRWRHPERGIVPPDDFIPLAEQLGLIELIGARALNMACEAFTRWNDQGFAPDRIAVNVSPREFTQHGYVARVAEILRRFDMPPLRLVLEITENLLIHDTDMIREQLDQLRGLGVSFSIDDFGIGYSSLSYLQKLPIDTLKIDGSFIQDVTTNAESQAIVAAILDMARRLGLDVVAEGVETGSQLAYLRDSGCNQIQGFVYSEPLSPDAFLAFLKTYPD